MASITEGLKVALADRYVIEQEIGAGGMAMVYLAQDEKHDRKVALKVLRPELAAVIGAERFLNEIKVTANLQHPHILPLHDSGEADTFLYYVMPFVEGDTLRDKLNREKQLGIDDAIEITRGVAAALDYAHRQGVIHRDIKPENILIHDGQPLVADFGIALAVSAAGGNRLTETGLSIGTPHYMSPEQAMGDRELDARSDVYSLGAMLYEMLAGDPPYTGSTAQAIVAKVITEKAPPVTATRDTVPGHVAAAIQKSLAKLPADRFASASDFAEALTNTSYTIPTSVTPAATAEPAVGKRLNLGVVAAVAAVAVFAAAFIGRATSPDLPQRLVRFSVAAPDSVRVIGRCCGRSMALSPDGTRLVFIGAGPGSQSPIYRREIGRLEAEPIPGTDGGSIPFFSPDGRWLGFWLDGYLRKVSMAGGPPVPIAETSIARGASWGDNDLIVFGGEGTGLHTVPAAGGEPVPVTQPQTGTEHRYPHMLPGGRAALFSIVSGGGVESVRIGVVDLETGAVDTIGFGTRAEFALGYLVYTGADQTLLAQPFDPKGLRTTDQAVALLDGVQFRGNAGMADFALSGDRGLAYQIGVGPGAEILDIVGPNGRAEVPLPETGDLEDPSFSPDGRRIALVNTNVGPNNDIWVFDREQGTLSRLTVEGNHQSTVWTRDGRRIAFHSDRDGVGQMYWKPFDGSGVAELLLTTDYSAHPQSWLPDGRSLLFIGDREGTGNDIGVVTVGDSAPTWILATEFEENQPQASPDGRWMAYTSDLSGEREVYVQALSGEGARHQVSTNGGSSPRWSPDGRTLYFVSNETLVAADLVTEPEFRVTSRDERFGGVTDLHTYNLNYDIHPNGEEFLVIDQSGGPAGGGLVWILDWTEIVRDMGGGR
jgi:serine/threonine-protein kinase